MPLRSRAACVALAFLASYASAATDPGVQLVGRGLVAGDALDLSGLAGAKICAKDDAQNCIDQATLGGFGSAIAYTGHDGVLVATPDRGPFDGRTNVPYLDRFHFLHLAVDTSVNPALGQTNITTTLLDTRFLKSEANKNFVGDAYAFNTVNPLAALRFDPEGLSIGRDGTFFVSDEYGPYINEFNREGHLVRRIPVPAKFLIAHPTGDVDSGGNSFELYPTSANPPSGGNDSGRQANRGMEGLAITPDGRYLVGIMQNALIQDNGLDSSIPPSRRGLNNRILKYDLTTGQSKEYVYTVDAINQGRGVNDILALNSNEFLVLERDNRSKVPTPPNTVQTPNLKRIYRIDLSKPGLSDVSGVASLPETSAGFVDFFGTGQNLVAITKTLFIDLLNPDYLVGPDTTIKDVIAEKVEGLAWGPDLPDGRHLLYVLTDNDLYTKLPTQIYAFSIDAAAAGVVYEPQFLPEPLFPPGQVKKILK